MRLQDHLPEGVEVEGRFYKCDFDFRNVLEMLDILSKEDLIQSAREYNALKCVMKHPRNVHKVLEAVKSTLFPKAKEKQRSSKRITDYVQDAGLIRTAFRQAYGIDLFRDHLHWLEFSELLNCIPDGSRYSEIVGIRARDIPAPTPYNKNEREWLIKAKASCALEMTEEERMQKYNEDAGAVFADVMNFFFKGSEKKNG